MLSTEVCHQFRESTCEIVATYCRGLGLYTDSWQSWAQTMQVSTGQHGPFRERN